MRKIKTKFLFITGAIFLVSYIVLVLNLSSNSKIALQSSSLLKDNYPSIKYSFTMLDVLEEWNNLVANTVFGDSVSHSTLISKSKDYQSRFDEAIIFQGKNITETGEDELTHTLINAFDRYKMSCEQLEYLSNFPAYHIKYLHLRESIINIQNLNVKVLEEKNEYINASALKIANVQRQIGIVALVILSFLTFFLPYLLLNPVQKLTKRLVKIYETDFDKKMDFTTKQEIDNLEEVLENILKETKARS